MIKNIRHKGIDNYWFKGKRLDLPPKAARKIQRTLKQLDNIESMAELLGAFSAPGFNLQKYHERNDDDDWEIRISGNWRMLFRWDGANICDIDYTDTTH